VFTWDDVLDYLEPLEPVAPLDPAFPVATVPQPDALMALRGTYQWLHDVVETLNPKERAVLCRRFELYDDDDAPGSTLEALGIQYGISRERVRQIQERALSAIRRQVRDDRVTRLRGRQCFA